MKYIVMDRETNNGAFGEFKNRQQAEQFIEYCETEDRRDKCYTDNHYQIVEKSEIIISFLNDLVQEMDEDQFSARYGNDQTILFTDGKTTKFAKWWTEHVFTVHPEDDLKLCELVPWKDRLCDKAWHIDCTDSNGRTVSGYLFGEAEDPSDEDYIRKYLLADDNRVYCCLYDSDGPGDVSYTNPVWVIDWTGDPDEIEDLVREYTN